MFLRTVSFALILWLALAPSVNVSAVNFSAGQYESSLMEAAAEHRDFSLYTSQMDAALQHKLSRLLPYLPLYDGAFIIDVGSGTGAVAAAIARENPGLMVQGIDIQPPMIAHAQSRYSAIENLHFEQGSSNKPYGVNADAVIMASVLHEIYSYNEDSLAAVKNALEHAYQALKKGGRIIIKDFARPEDGTRRVRFYHAKSDVKDRHCFAEFALGFWQLNRPVPIDLYKCTEDYESFETDMASAYDYMFRKDYTEDWHAEIKEHYGFIHPRKLIFMLNDVGFKVHVAKFFDNEWILEHRIRGKVWLKDVKTGEDIPIPKYDMVIVAYK